MTAGICPEQLPDDPGRTSADKSPATAAAGFVGLLSLFNMGGRFVWASTSDFIGRKTTYMVFFCVGCTALALARYTTAI